MVKKILLFAISSILITNSYANDKLVTPKKTVNAIAFWGFLDDPKITKAVEKECNVNFSHDAYYTNAEFLNTFNKRRDDYDIMIFSNMVYGSIKDQLPKVKSDLWKSSDNYYPYFKNYYLAHGYAHNVAFFTHAIMGFMYNPKVINIKPSQNMFEIFKNAKNNDVILVDDSGEIGNLLNMGYQSLDGKNASNKVIPLTYKNLKALTQNTKVFITSDFNKIYDSPNFAFSYIWSGDALLYIKKSKKSYKFVVPTTSSSICTDLLVQMKDTPEARCVAHALQKQSVLKYFENDTYYFTPYFKRNIYDKSYVDLYANIKQILPKLQMIEPVPEFFKNYDNQWDNIKLKFDEENN